MNRILLSMIALLQIAMTAFIVAAQEPKTAEEYYKRAMATKPKVIIYSDVWTKQTTDDLDRAIALDPKNSVYLTARARHLVLSHSPRAKAELDRVISLIRNADLYYLRSEWYSEHDNRRLKLDDRTNTVRLDPQTAERYSDRAYVYILLGQHADALADLTKAIDFDPKNVGLYIQRAQCYEALERRSEAEADYTRAVELDPRRISDRAMYYWLNGETAKAIADQTKVIERNPDITIEYTTRATMYEAAKEYEKAIADMTLAIKRSPKPDYLRSRANIYRKMGKLELADQDESAAAKLEKQ